MENAIPVLSSVEFKKLIECNQRININKSTQSYKNSALCSEASININPNQRPNTDTKDSDTYFGICSFPTRHGRIDIGTLCGKGGEAESAQTNIDQDTQSNTDAICFNYFDWYSGPNNALVEASERDGRRDAFMIWRVYRGEPGTQASPYRRGAYGELWVDSIKCDNIQVGGESGITIPEGNITLAKGNIILSEGDLTLSKGKITLPSNKGVEAGYFKAISDSRLKENFVPVSFQNSILDLPIYFFNFISDPATTTIGCKAQDLQKICPQLVYENENGFLSIAESKIVYLLIEEIKQLKSYLQRGYNNV